jgi:hypothetical protein
MPGPAYSVPTSACKVGGELRKIKGSVCEKCYASRGNYLYPGVQKSLANRLASITHPQWIDAIVYLITDSSCSHFRWHDSGDLQDEHHLEKICEVARRLPGVQFWLPTKEKALVKRYARSRPFPQNLLVRVSAAMIDGVAPDMPHTSIVVKHATRLGHDCPAPRQGNKCGACRACWSPTVKNVNYHYH